MEKMGDYYSESVECAVADIHIVETCVDNIDIAVDMDSYMVYSDTNMDWIDYDMPFVENMYIALSDLA